MSTGAQKDFGTDLGAAIHSGRSVQISDNGTVELLDDGNNNQVGLIVFDTSGLLDLNQQGGTDSDFEIEDANVTRATFYNSLNVSDHVKVRYDTGVEDQIEIELED